MKEVKKGDKVRVHYNGRLTSGEEFDSSKGRAPLEFTVGAGMMISGFDTAVHGMQVGQKKTVNIPAADAYGERRDDMVIEYPIDKFPEEIKPEIGMKLNMSGPSGSNFPVTITKVKKEAVTLDANHQLAGKELVFDIELVEIL